MLIKQKTRYAIRAIYELARRHGGGPTKIADISEAQAIPRRFLEVILNQLKHGGFVASKRGYTGGYTLATDPKKITIGAIVRFVEQIPDPLHCSEFIGGPNKPCPFDHGCALLPVWQRVQKAVFDIYDETTIQDLILDAGRVRPC